MPRRLVATGCVVSALVGCSGESARPGVIPTGRSDRDGGAPPTQMTVSGGFTDLTESLGPLPFALSEATEGQPFPEASAGLFADLDGDGRDEIILTPTRVESGVLAGRRAHVWRASTTGEWTPVGPVFPSGDGVVAGAVDLDGDGPVDLIVVSEALQVAWGHGDGTFDPPVAIGAYAPRGQFAPGAMN
ncbi:MAG: VCBS repeat-containing protein [Polyangiales bacterium]